MRFRDGLIAALVLASLAGACVRSDPGGECRDTLDCGPGLHCQGGECRSDCTSDAQCPGGSACTATGECLSIDVLTCEEGPTPAPDAVTSAFPTDAALLLSSLVPGCDFFQLDQVPPGFTDPGDLQNVCRRLATVESNHTYYLAVAGQFADCRPAQLAPGEGVWHELSVSATLDTALQARWSGADIDFLVGHSPPEGGPPTPGTIWGTGTSSDGGDTVALTVDGNLFRELMTQFNPSAVDNSDPGIGGPFRIDATFSRDADGSELVEHYRETGTGQDYDLHATRRSDALLVQFADQVAPNDPAFALQVHDDLSGRLDDIVDGQPRSLCWTITTTTYAEGFTLMQAHVVFSDAGGQRTGDVSACPFPEPGSP